VLTLSGVLKDILLVVLSVIIWGTPVTALQMLGYSIALAGLIYYKVGSEQAHAAYLKLTGDENSTFNRFRRSIWAKIGAGVLVLFVVLAMAHGFSKGRGFDVASTQTGLTGVPEPQMEDAYNPETEEPHGLDTWDQGNTPTHYTTDVINEASASHLFDVVIYFSPSSDNSTLVAFEEVLSVQSVAALTPRVTLYGDDHTTLHVANHISSDKITTASAAYLDFIVNYYDTLAQHTMFIHTDVNMQNIQSTLSSRFTSHTGVAELSQGGYAVCTCLDCVDTTHTPLTKTDELYALTNQNICSSTDTLLVHSTLTPC
jgi:hypothetical protein